MGYRLYVVDSESNLAYYGTKLYGYVNEKKLKSYKYLESLGFFGNGETFDYGCDNKIELTTEEFREFVKLYDEDIADNFGYPMGSFLNLEEITKLTASDANKIISWG